MTEPRHTFGARRSRESRYHVMVLCLWEEPDALHPIWRFSLESLLSTDRRGFDSLDALTLYLRGMMDLPSDR